MGRTPAQRNAKTLEDREWLVIDGRYQVRASPHGRRTRYVVELIAGEPVLTKTIRPEMLDFPGGERNNEN